MDTYQTTTLSLTISVRSYICCPLFTFDEAPTMNIESVHDSDEMEIDFDEDVSEDISSPLKQESKTVECRN